MPPLSLPVAVLVLLCPNSSPDDASDSSCGKAGHLDDNISRTDCTKIHSNESTPSTSLNC